MNARISQRQRARKLEATYVHHVYSQKALTYDHLCDGPWPEVRTFLLSLPNGSLVADVGCGNGKYLNVRDDIVISGSDICKELVELAHGRHGDVIRANNLCLPYRSESMDAVISVGVLHHFASPKRRLQSVRELARLLRPGGKLLIYVWAWEQKQRKFRAQDVLVPWSRSELKDCSADRTTKTEPQFSPNFPPIRKYSKSKSNQCIKNGHSSSLEQGSGCLPDMSSNESEQLDLSFDSIPNLRINANEDEFQENRESRFSESSLLKTSIQSETVVTIREKLQQFTKWKTAMSDGNDLGNSLVTNSHQNSTSCSRDRNKHCVRIGEKEEWMTSNMNFQMKCEYKSLPEYSGNSDLGNKEKHHMKTSKIVDEETCNNEDSVRSLQMSRFHRFYHVFKKDELLELVSCVPEIKVVSQYYDHGNWAVIAVKQSNNKMMYKM